MALAAAPLGLSLTVVDPDPHCPASVAARVIPGSLHDPAALRSLASSTDAVTVEIENVGVQTLSALEHAGYVVRPSATVLQTIGDKLLQKSFLRRCGVPVTPDAPSGGAPFSVSVVEKLRTGGYDGRGVHILEPFEEPFFSEPSLFESRVVIAREIAVLVCRFPDGTVVSWDPVGMVFDEELHLVTHVEVLSPESSDPVEPSIIREARAIAVAAAEALGQEGLTGILAVELFLDNRGNLMVNETAPRPHNSGHLTIETSYCNQFQQHMRAVAGLPPGDTTLHTPGVMRNIVAPPGCVPGTTHLRGVADALAVPGVAIHLYGKKEQRPGRKMGHLTAVGQTIQEARARADLAWKCVQFPDPRINNSTDGETR